ncbi:bifunctional phosphoribosylaminoimidazolecarboxamide formyltransferase/IMP cyclohydrolase [Candidatus Soleaferrea massiliensis]|uniref:bifunctional phosphoribosylaminoimidazolecarboxamide formyltransferase/IMP cyclohydrolase n=1 Tax=Candidatus Soleaferrea massiliensis TaxID=1470354 RepID=UPI00058EF8B3|nr:bifunctional phosphoribosylaminoimidazolecarboxamide formyltransferase/IMP cyclohydrolase [Candidatus Soleaferrea massiliensis]
MKRRALISVSDKTGVVEFAKKLEQLGFEIVSTGGTSKVLSENGVQVTNVSDITGFPECLDGRVKTLHPMVHAGILAMRSNPDHMKQLEELKVTPIDVVAINLYPFKATILKPDVELEDAIENIDIGGPTMIRAAAKNWQDVAVIVDPADYDTVIAQLQDGEVTRETKFKLSGKVFEHTASYDALISNYLRRQRGEDNLPETLTLTFEKVQQMRYGENPHQNAAFYKEINNMDNTLSAAKQLHGKELSYNNINDANGALDIIKEFGFDVPTAVAVKHANPCGVGTGRDLYEAYMNAYEADPVSIFGGIVALNRPVDLKTAQELAKIFLEIIIAPSFDADALEILTQKKNIRLLELPNLAKANTKDMVDMKKVAGGLLVQDLDTELLNREELKVVTKRAPTEDEMKQLEFAWKVVKHTKSNGIALAKDNRTVGIGPGQTNRITALELAIKYAGDHVQGSVMASDAFFPFSDCVEAAAKAGITAIIQPGGSIRDEDSIKACDEAGIATVFTGMRHFKH